MTDSHTDDRWAGAGRDDARSPDHDRGFRRFRGRLDQGNLRTRSAGAVTATYFTFLPCFLFILIGAPAIEASRHDIRLTAPLVGITAAVVSVVLNLALFFAYHVLWPQGFGLDLASTITRFEWFSAAIG
jgi:hypothetical protein